MPDAIELFTELREDTHNLRKKPATAELLVWLRALMELSSTQNPVLDDPENMQASLNILIKNIDDKEIAKEVVNKWQPTRLEKE